MSHGGVETRDATHPALSERVPQQERANRPVSLAATYELYKGGAIPAEVSMTSMDTRGHRRTGRGRGNTYTDIEFQGIAPGHSSPTLR